MRLTAILFMSIFSVGQLFAADTDNGKKNGADEVLEAKVFVTEHQAKFIRNSH